MDTMFLKKYSNSAKIIRLFLHYLIESSIIQGTEKICMKHTPHSMLNVYILYRYHTILKNHESEQYKERLRSEDSQSLLYEIHLYCIKERMYKLGEEVLKIILTSDFITPIYIQSCYDMSEYYLCCYQDLDERINLLKIGSYHNHVPSILSLADIYLYNDLDEEVLNIMRKALPLNDSRIFYYLAKYSKDRNIDNYFEYINHSIQQNNCDAISDLGQYYYNINDLRWIELYERIIDLNDKQYFSMCIHAIVEHYKTNCDEKFLFYCNIGLKQKDYFYAFELGKYYMNIQPNHSRMFKYFKLFIKDYEVEGIEHLIKLYIHSQPSRERDVLYQIIVKHLKKSQNINYSYVNHFLIQHNDINTLLQINKFKFVDLEENCMICMDDKEMMTSVCNHFMCRSCILQYYFEYKNKTCPMCRHHVIE